MNRFVLRASGYHRGYDSDQGQAGLLESIAATIMFGLTFVAVLTLVAVPVLFAVMFNIHPKEQGSIEKGEPIGLYAKAIGPRTEGVLG